MAFLSACTRLGAPLRSRPYIACRHPPTPNTSDSPSNSPSHIQNGQRNRILVVQHFRSKVVIAIPNPSQENGHIRGFRWLRHLHVPPQPGIATSPRVAVESFHKGRQADLEILLKHKNQKPVISAPTRIPKPSNRAYVSVAQLRQIRKGCFGRDSVKRKQHQTVVPSPTPSMSPGARPSPSGGQNDSFSFMQGTLISCTSKGIVSDITALKLNIGGELTRHAY